MSVVFDFLIYFIKKLKIKKKILKLYYIINYIIFELFITLFFNKMNS
jgi:hypothetical protein